MQIAIKRALASEIITRSSTISMSSWLKSFYFVCILMLANMVSASMYDHTIKQMENIYSNASNHKYSEFRDLGIVNDNLKFIQFLKEISENNQGELNKVTGYYHPVGFIKVILYKGSRGEQLRLHFWGQGGKKAICQDFDNGWEPIHNHRWSFSSKIIKGHLNMKEYTDFDPRIRFNNLQEANRELSKLNNSFKAYDMSIVPTKKLSNDYRVIKTGKFALIGNCMDKIVKKGDTYHLDHRTPHKVKSGKNTSTLLLMDPPSKPLASEIFPQGEEFKEDMQLQILTKQDVQKYIRNFLNELERGKND